MHSQSNCLLPFGTILVGFFLCVSASLHAVGLHLTCMGVLPKEGYLCRPALWKPSLSLVIEGLQLGMALDVYLKASASSAGLVFFKWSVSK